MAKSKRRSVKRGGAYGREVLSLVQISNVRSEKRRKQASIKKTKNKLLPEKQKRSRKQRKSFLSTLNQMGGLEMVANLILQYFKRRP